MDPLEFGLSTIPLQHEPYPLIARSSLTNSNAGKVALITGAQRGIGAAIAEALAASGAHVALLDLSEEGLRNTKEVCEGFGNKVGTYVCDVTDEAAVKEVLGRVERELGAVDILVNNAGIMEHRPLLMSTFKGFWRQIEVNFKGPLLLMFELLPRMRDRGHGCIINIASRSGTVDVPMALGYNTSKAALIRATHTLQREMEVDGLDPAIHMYALHPGGVLTDMGGSASAQDVKEKYGDHTRDEASFKSLFKDPPILCGQTCAFLASGKGKELRGLYIDCRQDLGKLLDAGREKLLKEKYNTLGVKFLEGYCNEP